MWGGLATFCYSSHGLGTHTQVENDLIREVANEYAITIDKMTALSVPTRHALVHVCREKKLWMECKTQIHSSTDESPHSSEEMKSNRLCVLLYG